MKTSDEEILECIYLILWFLSILLLVFRCVVLIIIHIDSVLKKWLGFLPTPLLYPYKQYIACDTPDTSEMLSHLVSCFCFCCCFLLLPFLLIFFFFFFFFKKIKFLDWMAENGVAWSCHCYAPTLHFFEGNLICEYSCEFSRISKSLAILQWISWRPITWPSLLVRTYVIGFHSA
jgi:hypothetical protein